MLFTVGEAAEVTGARLLPGSDTGEGSDVPILAVTHDSRQVQPGALFVALPGANTDGHLFLAEAFAGGAVAALVSRMVNPPPSRPCLLVPDTVLALGRLARWYRQRFRPVVVGITGSLGKTSTKDLAAAVLGTRWQVLCNQGNLNTEVGVPLTLLRLNGSVQVALIEMAMRGHGQIRYLADLAAPSMGVITNVSESHLELLGSVEEVARAKAELLEALPPGGLAVLNADDPRVRDMGRQFPGRVVYFALETAQPAEAAALVFASEVRSLGEEGTAFLLHLPVREPVPVHLPVPGRHQVSNALAAAALGWILGLSPEEIKRGLEHPRLSAMRMEVRRYGETVLINDAYNASPTSTAAALRVLMEVTGRRHLAVLADMLELGVRAVPGHREVGELVAKLGVDLLITAGPLCHHLAEAARQSGLPAERVLETEDAEAAGRLVVQQVRPGDVVLIKGSRGMKLERAVAALTTALTAEGGASPPAHLADDAPLPHPSVPMPQAAPGKEGKPS